MASHLSLGLPIPLILPLTVVLLFFFTVASIGLNWMLPNYQVSKDVSF